MILAVDVHYKADYAKTVVLLFDSWKSETYVELVDIETENVAEYVPGEFYKRELPCILDVLQQIDSSKIDIIIIDGYVYVDNQYCYGLGGYLYEALDKKTPIIGVAKTCFQSNKDTVVEVFRGESKNPLYVSAIGYDTEKAAQEVKEMFGDFRLPYLLKLMDQKTKEE
jgi:deoxyribonuclease V